MFGGEREHRIRTLLRNQHPGLPGLDLRAGQGHLRIEVECRGERFAGAQGLGRLPGRGVQRTPGCQHRRIVKGVFDLRREYRFRAVAGGTRAHTSQA